MEKFNSIKRTANYSKEECWRLVELIENYAHVIENKKTDALTWREKKTAWKDICQKFNSVGTQNRAWEQLRSKYEILKKETRRAVAKSRSEILGTGGGSYETTFNNPLYIKIKGLIKLSCDGTASTFDSDDLSQPIFEKTACTENALIGEEGFTSFVTDLSVIENNGATSNAKVSNSWSSCAQSKVQQVKLPVPQSQYETHATDGALLEQHTNNEESNAEVNNWSSYSPAQLRKQKHRALQAQKRKRANDSVNVSAAGRKMQPWLDAKTQLINLKLKLIQEEFNTKQEREQNIRVHAQQVQLNNQQIEINKLTIEKLKLEIKNLQK